MLRDSGWALAPRSSCVLGVATRSLTPRRRSWLHPPPSCRILGCQGSVIHSILGLLSLIFSSGKGILLLCAGTALASAARARLPSSRGQPGMTATALAALRSSGLILVYAAWPGVDGPSGPRFSSSPRLARHAAGVVGRARKDAQLWTRRLAALAAPHAPARAQVESADFSDRDARRCLPWNDFAHEACCHDIPEFSLLWRPFVNARSFSRRSTRGKSRPRKADLRGLHGPVYLLCHPARWWRIARQAIPPTRRIRR